MAERQPHPIQHDTKSFEFLRKEIYGSPTLELLRSWKCRWRRYSFTIRIIIITVLILLLLGGSILLYLAVRKPEQKAPKQASVTYSAPYGVVRVFQWCCDGDSKAVVEVKADIGAGGNPLCTTPVLVAGIPAWFG